MSLLSQSKTLAGGSRAFSGLRARQTPVVSNGCFATMKRKDSYMVEVSSSSCSNTREASASMYVGCPLCACGTEKQLQRGVQM